jgi:hypothetical protein
VISGKQKDKAMTKSVWETLSSINVNEHTEKKNGLTYLSWAWAWGMLKKHYPTAQFQKHITEKGLPYFKDEQGFAYVAVSVTVEEQTHTEVFPVLDYKNKAVQNPDAFAVNSALQRCLAKAISYHGLGHYIYAGEDLPQGDEPAQPAAKTKQSAGQGSGMIKTTFMEFIPRAENLEVLLNFYKKNEGTLKTLEELDRASHAEVMSAFKKRKEELQTEGVADGV